MNANFPLLSDRPAAWSSLTADDLAAELAALGQPAYRARQFYRSLRGRNLIDWESATDLPGSLRQKLASERPLRSLTLREERTSTRDGSVKLLFETTDRGLVESVLMFSRSGGGRSTVCLSSQIGCPAACTFCASGLGFTRNLTVAEITDQVVFLAAKAREQSRRVDNVVFMGMGEPFLNYSRVMQSIRALRDQDGPGIGARRITVSTVGIVPAILRFADEGGELNLAISLHAPNDELRSRLVPFNQRYPIPDLMAAARTYVGKTRRRLSFEYVLLSGTNDTQALAADLGRLLRSLNPLTHVNLIPWNPFPEAGFSRATRLRADAFAETVKAHGVNTTIRYSKGLDIDAACGQLRRRRDLEALAS